MTYLLIDIARVSGESGMRLNLPSGNLLKILDLFNIQIAADQRVTMSYLPLYTKNVSFGKLAKHACQIFYRLSEDGVYLEKYKIILELAPDSNHILSMYVPSLHDFHQRIKKDMQGYPLLFACLQLELKKINFMDLYTRFENIEECSKALLTVILNYAGFITETISTKNNFYLSKVAHEEISVAQTLYSLRSFLNDDVIEYIETFLPYDETLMEKAKSLVAKPTITAFKEAYLAKYQSVLFFKNPRSTMYCRLSNPATAPKTIKEVEQYADDHLQSRTSQVLDQLYLKR